MATTDDLQKQHEAEVNALLARIGGRGTDSDWALARALVHRAVHLVADRKAGEFCAVAIFLADMVQHAHGLMHPGGSDAPAHGKPVH